MSDSNQSIGSSRVGDPPVETPSVLPINVCGLSLAYGRHVALDDVSLQVQPGTVYALLGENGAGKTSLIRILTGYQSPASGSAQVVGLDPASQPIKVRRRLGYVSDSPSLYPWMTVSQIGGFAAAFYDDNYLPEYEKLVRHYDVRFDQKVKSLSKGQRAKVALALALAHDPPLLILDEPTSGLDPKVRRSFLESMIDRAAAGRTVLLSSHHINEVERVADRIGVLHHGRLTIDEPLHELRQSVRQITISLDDPLRTLPAVQPPAELFAERREGRQIQWIGRGFESSFVQQLGQADGVVDIRGRGATLEETFVAITTSRDGDASNA